MCPEPAWSGGTRMHETLYEEALIMSTNKNLLDVTTLLQFASEAQNPLEKARHIDRAIDLLRDVRSQLLQMSGH
jgi:hypothetical protein